MKRLVMLLAVASSAGLLGCGGGEVVVEAQLAEPTAGEGAAAPIALSELSVRLLPYDRDQIFTALEQAYPEPEPPIPDSLLQLQEEVTKAQTAWRAAESEWSVVRDSLKTLSDQMEALSRASGEYRVLFAEFGELEQREEALNDRRDSLFREFTALQQQFADASEEVRLQRQQWADEAFSSVDSVIVARLDSLELEEMADTTGVNGLAQFRVPPGKWWVYARYERPYDELYWNIPVDVARGDSLKIQLTPENAEVRPKL